MITEISGIAYGYNDQGNDGVDWAFMDRAYVSYERPTQNNFLFTSQLPVFDEEDTARQGVLTAIPEQVAAVINERSNPGDTTATLNVAGHERNEWFHELEKRRNRAKRVWLGLAEKVVTVTWQDGITEQRSPKSLRIEQWDMTGMRMLEKGDHLTIFNRADHSKVAWEGDINLRARPKAVRNTALGKTGQAGVEFTFWRGLFVPESPALLLPRSRS